MRGLDKRPSTRHRYFAALSTLFIVLSAPGCFEQSIEADKPKSGSSACTASSGLFSGGVDPGTPVGATSAQIGWSSLPGNCSTIYRVYQLPNMSSVAAWAASPASSVTISNLTPGMNYQFIVRAFDGVSEDTNLRVVNVTMPSAAIGNFSINTMATSTDHTPNISWTPATNAQSYKLEVAYDPSFTTNSTVLNVSGLTTTSFLFSQDLAFGKYWIRVTAQASGATDVVASNSPQTMVILPKFEGCLQAYGSANGESTGWQPAGCSKTVGVINNYMAKPQGLVFDSVSNYLYVLDNGTNRWNMNFYSSEGFITYYTLNSGSFSLGFQPNAGGRALQAAMGGSAVNAGCTDANYIYTAYYGRVERISRSTQTWAGQILSGQTGWSMTPSASGTIGAAWNQFGGGYLFVSCNSTDPYLYITDQYNHRISRWNKTTGAAAGVFGAGTASWQTSGTCCTANNTTAGFNYPNPIRLSSSGILYIIDYITGRVIRMTDLATPAISGWICNSGWGTTAVGAAGCNSSFVNHAAGFAVSSDSAGNVYTALGNIIRKFDSGGNFINQVRSATSQSAPLAFSSYGMDVKSDGSLVAVSDYAGARVLLFDGSLSYLGYIGAGVTGISPASANRPPAFGMGYYYNTFATDSASDSIYFATTGYNPGYSDVISRYQLSNPTSAAGSNAPELATGNATPCSVPGANPRCASGGVMRATASKTSNWLYVPDVVNGRVNRWNKTSMAYGGWIGNNTVGWQMANTVAPSAANCSFTIPHNLTTDANGYLYINDSTGNRVLVWRESDGTCIGTIGGGYTNIVPAATGLTSQAAVAAAKYFNTTAYFYSTTVGAIADWLYVYDNGSATIQRWTMTNGDPTTLTWGGWMGDSVGGGWKTNNFAGTQSPLFSGSTYAAIGSSGVIALSMAGGPVKLVSLGDGSEMGRALSGPDYEFYQTGSSPTSGDATGDGKVYGANPTVLYIDHSSKELFLHYESGATLRYK